MLKSKVNKRVVTEKEQELSVGPACLPAGLAAHKLLEDRERPIGGQTPVWSPAGR